MANTFSRGKLENISWPLDHTEDNVQEFRIFAFSNNIFVFI